MFLKDINPLCVEKKSKFYRVPSSEKAFFRIHRSRKNLPASMVEIPRIQEFLFRNPNLEPGSRLISELPNCANNHSTEPICSHACGRPFRATWKDATHENIGQELLQRWEPPRKPEQSVNATKCQLGKAEEGKVESPKARELESSRNHEKGRRPHVGGRNGKAGQRRVCSWRGGSRK